MKSTEPYTPELLGLDGADVAIYDEIEAIAAKYQARKAEIEAVKIQAARANLKLSEDYLTDLKKSTWRSILDKSNCEQWLSTKQQEKITADLYDNPQDLPEVTVETLREWLREIVTSSPAMIQELCREAFEFLTPQKSRWDKDYKSNENKREIPKSGRVVITYMCDQDTWNPTPRITYSSKQRLHVLDRVFALLDGKPKPEGGETAVASCERATAECRKEATVFWGRLIMHKNGNLHIWLTRPDLVKRLVELAAGPSISKDGGLAA